MATPKSRWSPPESPDTDDVRPATCWEGGPARRLAGTHQPPFPYE
jgi:hypothetical protein